MMTAPTATYYVAPTIRSYVRSLCAAMAITGIAVFSAQANDVGSEKGRLQVCAIPGTASMSAVIEIPATGNYTISGEKVGQTNQLSVVLDHPENTNNPRITQETHNGTLWLHLDLQTTHCIYLDAVAPVLDRTDLNLSGASVTPDWKPAGENDAAATLSFQYFNGSEGSYYIASEAGKVLLFSKHQLKTGSNLSKDRVNRVDVTDPKVSALALVAYGKSLKQLSLRDFNYVDLDKLNARANSLDPRDKDAIKTWVTSLASKIYPRPHSQLLLSLPERGPVRLKFTNTTLEGGKLAGLGFYWDGDVSLSGGSLAYPIDVFANIQTLLIDFDSGTVINSDIASESKMIFSTIDSESDSVESGPNRINMIALASVMQVAARKTLDKLLFSKSE